MKIKSTKILKSVVFTFAILLCIALSIAATGALYRSQKRANGTINLDEGIIIGYTGFEHKQPDADSIWQKNEVDFKLFDVSNALPGTDVAISPASIGAADGSVDFNARFKLEYKLYEDIEGTVENTTIDPERILLPGSTFVDSSWVLSTDGYYYYATGTTLNALTPNGANATIFANGAKYTINPEIEGLGFGYEIDGTLIKRVDVILTLETAQVGVNWEVKLPAYFNSNWKNLLATDANGVATGITAETIKTIEFTNAMPMDESYNSNNYIEVGATARDSTEVNNSVLAYYYKDADNLYHIAMVAPTGEEIYAPIGAYSLFRNLTTVTTIEFNNFNTTGVTNMSAMFNGCSSLTSVGDLSGWQVGNVTNMSNMFLSCSSLTSVGDLSGWQVGNVTNMSSMFNKCSSLTSVGDLSNWNVGNVTSMSGMFSGCSQSTSVGDLSGWQVGNVTNMISMFNGCSKLTSVGDLSGWQVVNVTNMSYMFRNCSSLTSAGDLSNWSVGNVTSMSFMFYKCSNLTSVGDLSGWQVGNVTDMSYMFSGSSLTSLDLSGWNLEALTNTTSIFSSCTGLTEIKAPAEIAAGMTLTLPTAPTGKKWVIEAGDGTAVTEIGNDTSITTLGETLVLVDA